MSQPSKYLHLSVPPAGTSRLFRDLFSADTMSGLSTELAKDSFPPGLHNALPVEDLTDVFSGKFFRHTTEVISKLGDIVTSQFPELTYLTSYSVSGLRTERAGSRLPMPHVRAVLNLSGILTYRTGGRVIFDHHFGGTIDTAHAGDALLTNNNSASSTVPYSVLQNSGANLTLDFITEAATLREP